MLLYTSVYELNNLGSVTLRMFGVLAASAVMNVFRRNTRTKHAVKNLNDFRQVCSECPRLHQILVFRTRYTRPKSESTAVKMCLL